MAALSAVRFALIPYPFCANLSLKKNNSAMTLFVVSSSRSTQPPSWNLPTYLPTYRYTFTQKDSLNRSAAVATAIISSDHNKDDGCVPVHTVGANSPAGWLMILPSKSE